MKRFTFALVTLLCCLFSLSACGKYDYSAHLSDVRSDLFVAETEEFTLTVSCSEREKPFLNDGIAASKVKTVEAVLAEKKPSGGEYELYFLEDVPKGGDMSFRNASGDYFYSRGVETFPEGSVSVRIVKDGQPRELVATSVRNEKTLTPAEALEKAVGAEGAALDGMRQGGAFQGEIHVRLLRRDKTYYYVGFVSGAGKTVALLLDSETGEVLARRESGL